MLKSTNVSHSESLMRNHSQLRIISCITHVRLHWDHTDLKSFTICNRCLWIFWRFTFFEFECSFLSKIKSIYSSKIIFIVKYNSFICYCCFWSCGCKKSRFKTEWRICRCRWIVYIYSWSQIDKVRRSFIENKWNLTLIIKRIVTINRLYSSCTFICWEEVKNNSDSSCWFWSVRLSSNSCKIAKFFSMTVIKNIIRSNISITNINCIKNGSNPRLT